MPNYKIKIIRPRPASTMYYNWSKADSYGCAIRGAIGKRGIGKTFTPVKSAMFSAIEEDTGFIYVVENKEQVKTLAQDKGVKFFEALKQYAIDHPKTHKGVLYKALIEGNSSVDEDELDEAFNSTTELKGGTIRLNGKNIGYIIAWDDFANIKRNNFPLNIKYLIIDEFMPEIIDKNSLKIGRKIVSLVQSIARARKDIIIYLMSNALRRTDALLERFKCSNIQLGEAYIISDKYGAFIYMEYIDPANYPELNKKQDESVAGRLATLLGEDNLDKNVFRDELALNEFIGSEPKPSTLLMCLEGKGGSCRIEITKNHKDIYVFEDYGRNTKKRYCIDQKYISPSVLFAPDYKAYLLNLYYRGICKFQSTSVKIIFLTNLNIEIEKA